MLEHLETRRAFDFHDWTARRINLKEERDA